MENGRSAGYSANVTELALENGKISQEAAGNWYGWNGTAWAAEANPLPTPTPSGSFPLSVSPNGRYFQMTSGNPFLPIADSPWALLSQNPGNQAVYFAARKAQGFNTVLISVLLGDYVNPDSGTGLNDWQGNAPFTTAGNFSTPNPAYFANVKAMVDLAATYGLWVCLYPMETGYWLYNSSGGALDGPMNSQGVAACQAYGAYIGNLLKSETNILWAEGNDYGPENGDNLVQAVRTGILSANPASALGTIEGTTGYWFGGSGTSWGAGEASDMPTWENEIQANWGYWYVPSYEPAKQYWLNGSNIPNHTIPIIPDVLGEGTYENEPTGGGYPISSPLIIRKSAWDWILYGGQGGYFYGNMKIWPFVNGWTGDLQSAGAIDIGYITSFFSAIPWQNLIPDFGHTKIIYGYGIEFSDSVGSSGLGEDPNGNTFVQTDTFVTDASTPSGVLVAYCPVSTTLIVALSGLAGPNELAQWYDPTNNTYTTIGTYAAGSGAANQAFTNKNNAAGDPDMILLLTPTK